MREKEQEDQTDPKPTKTTGAFSDYFNGVAAGSKSKNISLLLFLHLKSLYKFPWQERPWIGHGQKQEIRFEELWLLVDLILVHFRNIIYLKISDFWKKKLPWLLQRALLMQCLQTTWPATGKLAIDDLVNNWVVHGCWLCKQSWYHWKLNGNGIWLSKGWPHRDHSIRDPGNEEPCTDQHCHLVRGTEKKRERG